LLGKVLGTPGPDEWEAFEQLSKRQLTRVSNCGRF